MVHNYLVRLRKLLIVISADLVNRNKQSWLPDEKVHQLLSQLFESGAKIDYISVRVMQFGI